jgi:hypothetical protein
MASAAAAVGWKFSVTIPSWTTAQLDGDEAVVVRFFVSSMRARADGAAMGPVRAAGWRPCCLRDPHG